VQEKTAKAVVKKPTNRWQYYS